MKEYCLCDGRYDGCEHDKGDCDGIPGTRWGPYFCTRCDSRRIEHITGNLTELMESFDE